MFLQLCFVLVSGFLVGTSGAWLVLVGLFPSIALDLPVIASIALGSFIGAAMALPFASWMLRRRVG
jgi:ABC-type maltose transport system permease subunit